MKILITPPTLETSDNHNYSKGAIANIFWNFLLSLSKYDDIKLYVLSKGTDTSKPFPPNIKVYELTKSKIKNPHYIHTKAFINSIRVSKYLLKNQDISIINQMYLPYGVGFNPLLKTIRDYPFIIGMCELPHPRYDDEISKTEKLISKVGKRILYPLFLKTLDACDTLIAVNEPTKELYSKLIPRKKIRVIPYGVDTKKFQFTPLQKNNHNILVVSRLIKRRKLNILIDAIPSIVKEYPNTRLHIVGTGQELEKLLYQVQTYKDLQRPITFHGNVSEEELINLYKNCCVYCSPSEEDGWNQPILEAMGIGRPIICSNAPHNSMVVDNKTGFKMWYNESTAYSIGIKRLFGDFEMAQKMGIEGRREIEENYNWDDIGKKYYETYKEVI